MRIEAEAAAIRLLRRLQGDVYELSSSRSDARAETLPTLRHPLYAPVAASNQDQFA
jgi:hypothetical protein